LDYVRSRYAADYEYRLKEQLGQEKRILQDELITNLLETSDMDIFVSSLANGNTRGDISIAMDRDNCAGSERLHQALMDLKNERVVERVAKLSVLYTGQLPSAEEPAFNGGNLYRTDWKPLKELLFCLGEIGAWEQLEKERSTRGHVYRGGSDLCNRHGHSNDLPSYYAFGCQSLEEYHNIVCKEAWSIYMKQHSECCGVSEYVAKIGASAFRSE
jgi:hypothetical protein